MGVHTHSGGLDVSIVLVVEDDPDLRIAALAAIEQAEVNSAEAKSAEDALAYLTDHALDVGLIFSGFELPGRLDGIDLARVALLRWPWIKVLVTSGDARIRDVPQNTVLLPKRWSAADIHSHLAWETARARATGAQTAGLGHRAH